MPIPEPTWDYLTSDYVQRPKRPTPRHRAAGRARTGLYARATATLAAARQTARDALTAAWHGTDTPPGGLTLHAAINRRDRTTP